MSRQNNFGQTYYQNNANLGYSAVSKIMPYSSNFNYPGNQENFGEVEFMLDNERKKFREAKQKFENDLDNQRRHRIQCQNKLIKVKDQFSKKEIYITQLEFKLNNILHQNQDLSIENDKLKCQLVRLEELYGGKIHELESQLNMETHNFEETTIQYNTQFEKFKKQGQEYVEQLSFQFQRKIKNLEEKLKVTQNCKKELQIESKKLNDILINNKLIFQQQIRDLKNKAREEEVKKSQSMAKGFENKIKALEESKQIILRKNQDLLRALQDKDRQIQQLSSETSEEVSKYKSDNYDLHQQITHLNYLISKLKNQLAEKQSMISKSTVGSDHENQALKQQIQIKRQQNLSLSSTIKDLRQTLKQSENDWQRRRRQLTQRCSILESQSRKYKEEYLKICDMLKSRINETINNVSYRK